MSLQEEVDHINQRLAEMQASEKLVSDAYVRLRELLQPWGALDTSRGGEDRFERTERALNMVLTEYARLRDGIRNLYLS